MDKITDENLVSGEAIRVNGMTDTEEKAEDKIFCDPAINYGNRCYYPSDRERYPLSKMVKYDREKQVKITRCEPTYQGMMNFAEDILGAYGYKWSVEVDMIKPIDSADRDLLHFNVKFHANIKTHVTINFSFLHFTSPAGLVDVRHSAIIASLKLAGFASDAEDLFKKVPMTPEEMDQELTYGNVNYVPDDVAPVFGNASSATEQPASKEPPYSKTGSGLPKKDNYSYDFIDINGAKAICKDLTRTESELRAFINGELSKNIREDFKETLNRILENGIKLRRSAGAVSGASSPTDYSDNYDDIL